MRRRLILGMKDTQNRAAQSSQGEGTPRLRTGMRQPPLDHTGASLMFLPPYFGWSLLLFISFFRLSSSYTCQSSMPILKCTSPQPFFLVLCELLWPTSPYPGVTSISKGVQGVSCVYLIRRWQLFLGLPPHLLPYGLESLWWSSSGCPQAMWQLFLPWFWPAEDRVVLGSTFYPRALLPPQRGPWVWDGMGRSL